MIRGATLFSFSFYFSLLFSALLLCYFAPFLLFAFAFSLSILLACSLLLLVFFVLFCEPEIL